MQKQNPGYRKSIMAFLLVSIVTLSLVTVAVGDSVRQELPVIQKKMTLEKKYDEKVVTRFGDYFKVDKATLIVGADGKQVQYMYMLAPCEVILTYTASADGSTQPYASRIEIQKVLAGATNHIFGKMR